MAALSTALWLLALIPVLLLGFWTLSATNSSPVMRSFPTLYNKRICLLIAHPDDEAMFFAPTLLALTRPELGNHVKILCLSTGTYNGDESAIWKDFHTDAHATPGDADGLGNVRRQELQKSAIQLGLRNESDVFVLDDPTNFPDSITTTWPAAKVGSLLLSAFAPDLSPEDAPSSSSSSSTAGARNRKPSSDAPKASIDVLITFDESGVSQHPNHRSLYHGALSFLGTLMKGKSGYACPVSLYTLTSTNILRKYAGVLDAPVTMLYGILAGVIDTKKRAKKSSQGAAAPPNRLLYVSGIGEWMAAWKAMVNGHQSQMVWFRWGWITIGRYMVVNDLKRERI